MANKIIFGADLIDVLENKYNMNKLGEVPTKYKNGITTIDFIYGKEKDIDDLKYDKPYVEFSIDDETDGFISGTMYLNGGVEGIQFDSWEDLKYFMKNAKWTESRKSLKESKDSDFFNGIAKEYHFSKDEKTRYKDKTHISAIGVLFDRINDAIKIYGRNSNEEYNALNDCWSVITSAKQNGWNVDYEEDKWNKIAGLPNYH